MQDDIKGRDSHIGVDAPERVSSGSRGRSVVDLVEEIERSKPNAFAATGLSSAALRAAEAIRAMRLDAQLTQGQLAARIGVKPSRISELEAGVGRQGPTWDVMERIAAACNKALLVAAAE